LIRVELCTEGLSVDLREAILDSLYQVLRISPGEVTADGDFELDVVTCGEADASGAPYLRVGGVIFARVTPQRARDLVSARRSTARVKTKR
jgi:NADH:ubiquinone oxidoreductase subunit E